MIRTRASTNCVAVVPAKRSSVRLPGKNWRPFYGGMSLVEIKIRILRQCPPVSRIVVSTDDESRRDAVAALGADFVKRDPEQCTDHLTIRQLVMQELEGFEDDLVYWAHPTSPFVAPSTVNRAIEMARQDLTRCVFGVERLYDYLWNENGPVNYDPEHEPRSQDLSPLWRVTGGIHIASGSLMKQKGAQTFLPHKFIELGRIEALDINNPEDWALCSNLAPSVMPSILELVR